MRKKFARRAAAEALLLAAACPSFAQPQVGLSAPCALPDWPPAAIAGAPPTVATWTLARLPREWAPQPCVGWEVRRFSSFAAVVGTFQAPGMEAVLDRIGAISTFKGMRYWSVSDRRLEPLVADAFSVESSGPSNRRPDFTPNEMQVDRDLFFVEHDNRASEPVRYRIRVLERSADHFVVDIANADKVRSLFMTLFEPGDLRTSLFLYGSADGTWTCYALSGFHSSGLTGLLDKHKSFLNRLIALYGHIAGADDRMLPWAQ